MVARSRFPAEFGKCRSPSFRRATLLRETVVSLGVVVALIGCGGGGGGSVTPTVPTGPVRAPAFALDTGNAVRASVVVFEMMDHVGEAAAHAIVAAEMTTLTDDRALLQERAKELRDLPDLDGYRCPPREYALAVGFEDPNEDKVLDEGETLIVYAEGCGVRQDFSLVVSAIDVSSNGTMSVAGDADLTVVYETGLRMQGTFVLARSNALSLTVKNAEITHHDDGHVNKILDGNLERSSNDGEAYTIRLDGNVDSMELGGGFGFRTVHDLTGVTDDFPESGEVLLSAGDTRVRVGTSGEPGMADHADVEVDNGDGETTNVGPVVWRSLVRGLFGTPNSRPEIERLTITPAPPKTDDVLNAAAVVRDPDRDRVTYAFEWYRNGVLIDGYTKRYLEEQYTRKHDRIEVSMRVSDERWTVSATANTTIENSIPVVAGLAITPDSPTTIDDLVSRFDLTDADADELAETYTWTIGDVVSSHGGLRLPAASHSKGDQVTFRIAADDGETSMSAQTSVEIVDAPPRVAVAAAPQQVRYGERARFSASVADPDGEPVDELRYRIVYGPPAMEVDPESGMIEWAPTLAMFDREMDVAWAVEVDHPDSSPVSGVISLRDPDRHYPFMRLGRVEFISTFRIGDFDADGVVEILSGIGDATFIWTGETYEQAWGYPFANAGFDRKHAVTADVDGDGRHEIFTVGSAYVTRLDGVNRRLEASMPIRLEEVRAVDAADLDGDGDVELVGIGNWPQDTISVLDAADLEEAWFGVNADFGTSFAIGNVDDDPALEIVTVGGFVIDGATYEIERINDWAARKVAVGDIDGDGVDELIAGYYGLIRAYDARANRMLWEFDTGEPGLVATGDVDGDAVDEILYGGSAGLTVYRSDGEAHLKKWGRVETPNVYDVRAIAVGDLDGDGHAEIVWSDNLGQSYVARTRPDIGLKWTNEDIGSHYRVYGGALVGGPDGGDVLLFASLKRPFPSTLIALSPDSGRVTVGATLNAGWSQWTGDYDRNGNAEMILSLLGETPELVAYDFAAGRSAWVRRWPPGGAAAITGADVTGDGNDDLVTVSAYDTTVTVYDAVNDKTVFQSELIPGDALDVDVAGQGSSAEVIVATTKFGGDKSHLLIYSRTDGDTDFVERAKYVTSLDIVDMVIAGFPHKNGTPEYEVLVLTKLSYQDYVVRIFDQDLTEQRKLDVFSGAVTRLLGVRMASDGRRNLVMEVTKHRAYWLESWDLDAEERIWKSPVLPGRTSRDGAHWVTIDGKTKLSLAVLPGMMVTR